MTKLNWDNDRKRRITKEYRVDGWPGLTGDTPTSPPDPEMKLPGESEPSFQDRELQNAVARIAKLDATMRSGESLISTLNWCIRQGFPCGTIVPQYPEAATNRRLAIEQALKDVKRHHDLTNQQTRLTKAARLIEDLKSWS